MKTILLIDDLRVFRENTENELHVARNSAQALEILRTNPEKQWDEIWFDHDLGMVEGKEDTTLPVADYLAERAFFHDPVKVGKVVIHTSNPVGARVLTTTLQRYGYVVIRVQAEHYFSIDMNLY